MWRSALIVGVAAMSFGLAPEQAVAASVCYAAESVPVFFRLDVERHSRLTTFRERRRYGNPVQTAYSAHGMIAFQEVEPVSEEPMHGTITVAHRKGARSTFDVRLLFPTDGDQQLYTFDCFTEEASATPELWRCRALVLNIAEGGVQSISVPLTSFARVDPLEHELCSLFILPEPDDEAEQLAGLAEPAG